MSDVKFLRYHSSMVADQLVATMGCIERLRIQLVMPDRFKTDTCAEKRWMDASVLDNVKRMVSVVLARHLAPLRAEEFPKVFEMELKNEDEFKDQDNLTIREIKESNCLGALALLYFYFFWHLVLIGINRRNFSDICGCQESQGNGDLRDWDNTLKKLIAGEYLPKADELLELKTLHKLDDLLREVQKTLKDGDTGELARQFKAAKDKTNDILRDIPSYTTNNGIGISRQASLVFVYRSVFHNIFSKKDGSSVKNVENSISFTLSQDLGINSVRIDYMRKKMAIFGKMLSMYEIQDELSIWNDMNKKIEIQTNESSNSAVFRFNLAKILMGQPYSSKAADTKLFMKSLAIYDYGSALLMMDVLEMLKALVSVLGALLEPEKKFSIDVFSDLFSPILYRSLSYVTTFLSSVSNDDETLNENLVFDAFNSYHDKINITSVRHSAKIYVDYFTGYYWGATRLPVSENVNHIYVSLSGQKENDDDSTSLAKMQQLSETLTVDEFIVGISTTSLKNSLFSTAVGRTLDLFINKLKCNKSMLKPFDVILPVVKFDTVVQDFNNITSGKLTVTTSLTDKIITNPNKLVNIDDLSEALNEAKTELSRYSRLTEAKTFQRYTCISWPVEWVDSKKKESNSKLFVKVRATPQKVKSLGASLQMMSSDIRDFSSFARNFLESTGSISLSAGAPGSPTASVGDGSAPAAPRATAGSGSSGGRISTATGGDSSGTRATSTGAPGSHP